MTEYIDREAVYNTLKAMYCDECTDEKCQMCEYANIMFVLDNLPIADVQPEKRGKWEEIEDHDGDVHYRCTNCKTEFYLEAGTPDDNEYFYCPYCGARMMKDGDTKCQ